MSVSLPVLRWNLFECLNHLALLRKRLEDPTPFPHDYNLLETYLGIVSDELLDDPYSVVGTVLFDAEEAAAFAKLCEMPITVDWYAGLEAFEAYVRGAEFAAFLDQAEVCRNMMFGPGRGLPGWDQREHGFGPAVLGNSF